VKAPLTWLKEFVELPADASIEKVGRAIADAGFEIASIEDGVIDFEITANRPDCLSIRGLAREAATAMQVQGSKGPGVQGSKGPEVQESKGPEVRVSIESPLCGRFALAMADVTIGPSPAWLADRLTACGIRPINNIVDVTNYVMLETGQPLHAYDAAKVRGSRLVARMAHAGEQLTTLDGQDRKLSASMLVIADDGGAVGVAGVMGGASSEVSLSTTRIALEAAWFQPATVRATSKTLGLKTEAAIRFERGADIEGPPAAIDRALALLEDIGAGRRASATSDEYPSPVPARTLTLRADRLARLLGDDVPADDVTRILSSLGFELGALPNGWQVRVPSWRVDVSREADLIEEVGRHWGVNRVPAAFPALRRSPQPSDPGIERTRRLGRLLCGAGLQEAVTFTFMEAAAAEPFAPPAGLVTIANPLSEKFAVLRPSLLPGLLDSLTYNRRRGQESVRLFEAGATCTPAGESRHVAWVMCGARSDHWSDAAAQVDVFDALGIAELLGAAWNLPLTTEPTTDAAGFMPGRMAALMTDRRIGVAGQLLPALTEARGLPPGVVVVAGEMELSALTGMGAAPERVAPLPKFPAVVRDISLLVDATLSAATIRATIRQPHGASTMQLSAIREFDRYQGKGIPDGQVSLAYRLTFRDPGRTLTDREVDEAMATIIAALQSDCGATIRGL
jgi:phenylalanyl-tRNA synthetase beta chain